MAGGNKAIELSETERDLLDNLLDNAVQIHEHQAIELKLVSEARDLGIPWDAIGGAVGLRRQSVWEKYRGKLADVRAGRQSVKASTPTPTPTS